MEHFTCAKSVTGHSLFTDKFKTITLTCCALLPTTLEQATALRVLGTVLSDRTEHYPTKQAITDHASALYGAQGSVRLDSAGLNMRFIFDVSLVDGQYVDLDTWKEGLDYLEEMIFHPYSLNGKIHPEAVEEAKQKLTQIFLQTLDEPSSALNHTLYQSLQGGLELRGIRNEEDIRKVTPEDVQREYERLLREAQIDLFFTGRGDQNQLQQALAQRHWFEDRDVSINPHFDTQAYHFENLKETRPLPQSEVGWVFTAPSCDYGKPLAIFSVANGLFGLLPSSLLFQEVREKHSLCYSIYSIPYFKPGLMVVRCSLEAKNLPDFRKYTLEQWEKVKQGDFSKELLQATRQQLMDSIASVEDRQSTMVDLALDGVIYGYTFDQEQRIQDLASVTKEEVVDFMNQTVFKNEVLLEGTLAHE